jgi:hypothetical protein
MAHPTDYQIAHGLAGLQHAITDLFVRQEQTAASGPSTHYLLYQLAEQQALLRIDLGASPAQCWHYDLQGRPAAQGLINAIGRAFWEQLTGDKPAYDVWRDQVFRVDQFNDVSRAEAHRAQAAFLSGQGDWVLPAEADHTLTHARILLEKAAQQKARSITVPLQPVLNQAEREHVTSMLSFGLFRKKTKHNLKSKPQEEQDFINKNKGPGVK